MRRAGGLCVAMVLLMGVALLRGQTAETASPAAVPDLPGFALPMGQVVRVLLKQVATPGDPGFVGKLTDASPNWIVITTDSTTERQPGKVYIPMNNVAYIHAATGGEK